MVLWVVRHLEPSSSSAKRRKRNVKELVLRRRTSSAYVPRSEETFLSHSPSFAFWRGPTRICMMAYDKKARVTNRIFIAITISHHHHSKSVSFVSAFVVALPGACLNLLFVTPHLDCSMLLALFSRNFKKHLINTARML